MSGVGTAASAPSRTIGPRIPSVSVRRLRTAMSRQMPLWVLADLRLKATSASSERSETALGAAGANALGSKPSNPSGVMWRACATRITSRAISTYTSR